MDTSQEVIFISETAQPSKKRMNKKKRKALKKAKICTTNIGNKSSEQQPIKSSDKPIKSLDKPIKSLDKPINSSNKPIKLSDMEPRKSPEKQPQKKPKTSFMNANIVDDSIFETAIVIDESNLFTIDQTGADIELDSISSISINCEDLEKTVIPQVISVDSDSEPEIFEINDSVIVVSDTDDLTQDTNDRKRKRKNKNFESWVDYTDKPFIIEKKEKIELPPCTANSYIPYPTKETKTGLRPIVIDGCNVAFGHGKAQFSSLGLKICVDYFKRRGHTVKVFVPQYRRRHNATRDSHLLDDMEKEGILVYTPSRNVNGRWVVSYDDRYIVEYAHSQGGVIVTRDNYRDLSEEHPEWMSTIFSRLLMYTWVDDMIMFPEDPLGRGGPTLNQFLRF